jgi:alpha-tubulin suppressor-like RCC1 family protein
VACWGDGDSGQLGNGATRDASRPVLVTGIDDALRVSVGGSLSCALRRGGRVACWGTGHGNRLGLGRGRRASEPVSIDGLSSVVQVVVGLLHACALRDDGVVLCWGGNPSGQCGVEPPGWGLGRSVFPPFAVAGLRDVVELAGEGSTHTCARRRDGHVLCWGHGARGELGNGALTSSHRPVEVVGISDAVEVASSDSTCVRTRAGRVLCWGSNSYGVLGQGCTSERCATPVAITGFDPPTQLTVGGEFACGRLADGYVTCWGRDEYGQLGDGQTVNRSHPEFIRRLSGVVEVDAGLAHACARRDDGSVWCWGSIANGRLGNGAAGPGTFSADPVRVEGLPGAS